MVIQWDIQYYIYTHICIYIYVLTKFETYALVTPQKLDGGM